MNGIGGSTPAQALAQLSNMATTIEPITLKEYQQRLQKACELMKQQAIDAMLIHASSNLTYFTGTQWYASERFVGAILFSTGELIYICPHFEQATLSQYIKVSGAIATWHEHESPFQLIAHLLLSRTNTQEMCLAVDEQTPFFMVEKIQQNLPFTALISATSVASVCRQQKSEHEIALLQTAKNMTLAVQQAAASILYEGISTQEVTQFIDKAHQVVGAPSGSYFCIVLFGQDTAYPHGVKQPKTLTQNDMVLIDTGCCVEGYHSDITRSYIFGKPTEEQRRFWQIEKNAQLAAFNAARLGEPCAMVDKAARDYLASEGLGPNYQTPGCPHRTGHGIGLDIHEAPYLVLSEQTRLKPGMCFSNEPMLVIPDQFGIRLEDHFYMTADGPRWFTEPANAIDAPFG